MKQFRLFSLLAAALLSAPLWAQGPWTSGDCTVTLADGVLTVSGSGPMGSKPNPSWTDNSIKGSITSVVVESGVTELCINAFYTCTNITSVSLPSSLERIGQSAFNGCSKIEEITIPVSVNFIHSNAFRGCSKLKNVYLLPTTPPGLNTAGNPASTFENCHKDLKIWCPDGYDDDYMNDGTWCQYFGDKLYNVATGEHAPLPTAYGNNGSAEYQWSLSNGQLSITGAIGLNINMPTYTTGTVPWRN